LPVLPGELREVLAQLVSVQIEGPFNSTTDQCGLDNVEFLAPCAEAEPELRIEWQGSPMAAVILAWPASALCFQLETTACLAPAEWSTNYTALSSATLDGWNRVTLAPANASRFFRLVKRP